jgi:hypothetical protein
MPGQPCDPVKHGEHADFPRVSGRATEMARAMGIIAEPESLNEWEAHLAVCGVCTEAPTVAGLCLAGAVIAARVGLAAPETVQDAVRIGVLRTSELLRLVASRLDRAEVRSVVSDAYHLARELEARAAYVGRLGSHDHGGATCTGCGERMS